MKLFECQNCGQPLYFENTRCESCGLRPRLSAGQGDRSRALEEGERRLGGRWRTRSGRYRYCANAQHDVCNWLVPADSPDQFCAACRHNRMIPDLSILRTLANWRKIEVAKHRLFYTLLKLRLPLTTRDEDAGGGLAFDFLAAASCLAARPVMTGHEGGLITINLAEADDSERERQRRQMGEPYRTLLGHFRHEVAHYYWDQLVKDSPSLEEFRELFGDERQDYGAALQKHYAEGPPAELAGAVCHRLCQRASVGGFRRNLGALFPHGRHAGDRQRLRARVRPKVSKGADLATADRFRSAQRRRWTASSTPGCR